MTSLVSDANHFKKERVLYGGSLGHKKNGGVELRTGEFLVVPHGIEHRTVAEEEVEVIIFEPAETRNLAILPTTSSLRQVEYQYNRCY